LTLCRMATKGSDRLCAAASGTAVPVPARAALLKIALRGTKLPLPVRQKILPDTCDGNLHKIDINHELYHYTNIDGLKGILEIQMVVNIESCR
ncbi:MAG: hypothetical protein NC924_04270, partial [Candidatus Omnitrophica bacterium]|nr:hypothetical protein [Candidatus Omnitrophota bacterium]